MNSTLHLRRVSIFFRLDLTCLFLDKFSCVPLPILCCSIEVANQQNDGNFLEHFEGVHMYFVLHTCLHSHLTGT